MIMLRLLQKVKDFISYDADREFYAKVFPGSVSQLDLIRIRKMDLEDLPRVLEIESQNYQFPWTESVFKDCFIALNYSCWVCEEDEKVVGYAIISIAVGEAHVMNVSIAPEAQGIGLGRKMMAHLIDLAGKRAETVLLEVRPSNDKAIALYKKLGFSQIGVRKDYYPAENGREDAIMLALHLASLF